MDALARPVQFLKGVGPKRAKLLERLEIRTLDDLIHHFPREWQDRRETREFLTPSFNAPVVFRGRVMHASHYQAGLKLGIFKAILKNAAGEEIEAIWFKRPTPRFDVFAALRKEVQTGADLWVVGRPEKDLFAARKIQVEEHYAVSDPRARRVHVDRIVPIYPLTEGVSQRFMRELMHRALSEPLSALPNFLPASLVAKHRPLKPAQAYRGVHFPASLAELEEARRRLVYEEFLLLELAWAIKRRQTKEVRKGYHYELTRALLTPFKENLGFALTRAQTRVINEIFEDLRKSHPMTRLLQGDVGSGKTVVALSALLLAVESGHQGALMAPTEILAEQHALTVRSFLEGLPVRTALLTSRVKGAERRKIVDAAKAGEVDVLIGTHALLEEDVRFPRLRLAVIDEQHRFGVRQRAVLRQKNAAMDLLIMTATPIPRTLALALYGDLDISTLDEMPPNRRPVETRHIPEREAFEKVRAEVAKGRQAYVVYPVIDESKKADLKAAKLEHARLKSEVFPDLEVALIHGQMKSRDKNAVMAAFAEGRSQVLVATQVVEVGVDVPNATVMVVEDADRFGLASLHQLRGRVGRGAAQSHCLLVGDPKTPEAEKRIETLVATSDGFQIGEEDLKLRGPGEILGVSQHGQMELRIGDMFRDGEILGSARRDAVDLLAHDPHLMEADNQALKARLVELYQNKWKWIDLA